MVKLNILQRITFTALFLALGIIATRFLGIYITPYVRLSLGLCVTIFSSIFLGPISGAIIAGVGDILGIVLWNTSGVAINPFITISYALMGAIPGLFIMLFRKIQSRSKFNFIVFHSLLLLIWIGITVFSSITKSITLFGTTYDIEFIARILIPIISFILFVGISVGLFFFNRHFKKKVEDDSRLPSPYQIAFIVLFIEIFFTLIINTLIKSFFYGIDFSVIFFPHLLLAFIYIPLNTIIVSYLCLLALKSIRLRE